MVFEISGRMCHRCGSYVCLCVECNGVRVVVLILDVGGGGVAECWITLRIFECIR